MGWENISENTWFNSLQCFSHVAERESKEKHSHSCVCHVLCCVINSNFLPIITRLFNVTEPPSERTYQDYEPRPFTRAGQVLRYFFVNQELCVIGIWSLRFSWWTRTIFPEAETSAQAGCGQTHANVRRDPHFKTLSKCAAHTATLKPTPWENLYLLPLLRYKLNKEQTDDSINFKFLPD